MTFYAVHQGDLLGNSRPREFMIDFADRMAYEFFPRPDNMRDVAIWGGGIVVAIVRSRASGGDVLWITEDMKT